MTLLNHLYVTKWKLITAWTKYKYRLQETYDIFIMWRQIIVYRIPYQETMEESIEFFFDCLTFYD